MPQGKYVENKFNHNLVSGSTEMQQRMPPKTPAQSSLSYYTPSTQAPQTATVMLYIKLKQPLKNPGRFLASLGIICYIESVNIATMPLGIWYVTNMGLLAHATQHSAYSLTALLRHLSWDCGFRAALTQQAGVVWNQGQFRFMQPQENKPAAPSSAALCS